MVAVTVYRWVEGYPSRKVDPQEAGDLLEGIRENAGGALQPSDVVKAAKPKRSPIHPLFEWDDQAAAEAYRLDQARDLIRSVGVVYTNPGTREERTVRAFVNVIEADKRQYTSVAVAMAREDLRDQVMHRALMDLQIFEAKYRDLNEFSLLFQVANEVKAKVQKKAASS